MIIRRPLTFVLTLVLLFTATATSFPSSTFAAPTLQPSARLVKTIAMNIDCARVPNTPEAHKALKKYHLCGYTDGGIQPANVVPGSCGNVSLFLFDDRNGVAQWKFEVSSTIGTIVSVNYNGSWRNNTTGRSAPVNRSYLTFTSDSVDTFPLSTGAGSVIGSIPLGAAQDTTIWGGVCTNTNGAPWDLRTIT